MRLALSLPAINAANPRADGYIELAKAAERFGYEAIWAPEAQTTEPFTLLGWIGSHTSTIGLGCAVAQISARTAVAMAASAITAHGLSGGRFRLGLGVSGPQVVEGWHGRRYERPLSYLSEYLTVLRMALNAEPLQYCGREIKLPAESGAKDVQPLPFPAPPNNLPVHLAGLGQRAIALSGEKADGWIAIHCPPAYMAAARAWVRDGAARSGRSLDGFSTSVMLACAVDEDEELARDLVRPRLAFILGAMGTRSTNFYSQLAARLGLARAANSIREAYLAGELEGAIAAADDELVDTMALCGNEKHVRERLESYRQAGVSTVMIVPAARSVHRQIELLELMSSLAG